MGTVTYSKSKDGSIRITPNFQVKELACKDGSDKVLVDHNIVISAQTIRDLLGATSAHVASGYRTPEYNKSIGGSETSKHCKGQAMDLCYKKGLTVQDPKRIACIAQVLGIPGIEVINTTNIHIDCRDVNTWYAVQLQDKTGKRVYVTIQDWFTYTGFSLRGLKIKNPFPVPQVTVLPGNKGNNVRWMQYQLCLGGYLAPGAIDGKFGPATEAALRRYQSVNHLEVDAHCGPATRKALSAIK